jgi:hypothetical protein
MWALYLDEGSRMVPKRISQEVVERGQQRTEALELARETEEELPGRWKQDSELRAQEPRGRTRQEKKGATAQTLQSAWEGRNSWREWLQGMVDARIQWVRSKQEERRRNSEIEI